MPRNKENQSANPKHWTNWIVEDNSSRNFRGGYTWDIQGQKTKISNYFLLLNTRRNFCELDKWEFYFHYWLCRSTAHIGKWAINERKFQRKKFKGSLEWKSWRNSKKRNLAILHFDNWSNQSRVGHYVSMKKWVLYWFCQAHLRVGLVRSSKRFLSSVDNLLATFQFLRSSFQRSL